jgi:hypothetical protein
MFDKIVPVTPERHRLKKVRNTTDFQYASNFHIAYITLHEFARAAAIYPIVFLEDKTQEAFRPVVLMGLQSSENLFVAPDGTWRASYIPAMIRRYPFALGKAGSEGKYLICVDEGSDLLSDTEGAPLFDDKGAPTQVIENVKTYLTELQQMDLLTADFNKFLVQHNLLTPLNMRVNSSDQARNITGCFVINEERLNNFSDALFLDIRHKGYLPAMYAHLLSLPQIERLVQLQNEHAQPAPAAETEEKAPAPRKRKAATKH